MCRQPDNSPRCSFNSQPPEGGWRDKTFLTSCFNCFNSQPPEGGWELIKLSTFRYWVSTHSRPKAAGYELRMLVLGYMQFQLTAARRRLDTTPKQARKLTKVSTHSRPKAAGFIPYGGS